jgi:hypothetical protein
MANLSAEPERRDGSIGLPAKGVCRKAEPDLGTVGGVLAAENASGGRVPPSATASIGLRRIMQLT